MEMRARRALMPVLAAVFLLVLGWHGAPALATSIDPELVVESVTEDGYYVDSNAPYLTSDADLDKLRAALQQAGRAGVVVLPAGAATAPVLNRLLQSPNRNATYVVMSGGRLQAASTTLSKAQVSKLVAKATRAGSPKAQLLAFLGLLNPKKAAAKSGAPTGKASDLPQTSTSDGMQTENASAAPAAAGKNTASGGGHGMLYGGIGVVIIVVLGAAGGYLWRRRHAASTPGGGTSGAA